MLKRIAIVLLLMGAFGFRASAYDFAVAISNGDTLFFEVIDEAAHHVMVVPPVKSGPYYYHLHQQPSGTLVIPDEVTHNGQRYQVTAIGDRAFSGCTKIQLVVLPEHVREIGSYAFYGCTAIKGRVSIGVDVKRIGASAFYGCSLIPEVNFRAKNCEYMGGSMGMTVFGNCRSLRRVLIDEGVLRIPDFAFCGVNSITDSLRLPASLQSIGNYAFAYCSNLSGNVTIPDRVDSIGECAFLQCHKLESVTIGTSMKYIGARSFDHCVGLKQFRVATLFPPEVTATTFAAVPKTTRFVVPCVSKLIYDNATTWKRLGPFEVYGVCSFAVSANMDNPKAGQVLGAGEYGYGDSVKLMVVCNAGYGFDGWSDGNKENPRCFSADDNANFTAVTRPSGTLVIRDTIYRVDTVYAEGYKVVRDTVDLIEVSAPINGVKEVTFDTQSKRLKWSFPRTEKVIAVSLYNQAGECLHTSDGRKGSISMKRLSSGTYFIRIETLRRIIRCRMFIRSDGAGEKLRY